MPVPKKLMTRGKSIVRSSFTAQHNFVLALLSEAIRPLLRLYVRSIIPTKSTPPAMWRKVLIIGENHLGDVLFRTPSLPTIRRMMPSAEISYLASPVSAQLLAGNPNIDHILTFSEKDSPFDVSREHVAFLREMKFDAVLVTSLFRHWSYLLLALKLGSPNRACYAHKGFSGLISHPVYPRLPGTCPAYFRDFVSQLFQVEPDWTLRPQVFLDAKDEMEAEKARRDAGIDVRSPVVAMFCTSRQEVELWPEEKWAECARNLAGKSNLQVVLLGAANDARKLQRVAAIAGNAKVLAGVLSIRGLAAFLKQCSVILSTDSGPRHLGNAVNTPVVYIRNLASLEEELAPYCDTETDVAPHGSRLNPSEQKVALSRLSAEHVAGVVLSKMRL